MFLPAQSTLRKSKVTLGQPVLNLTGLAKETGIIATLSRELAVLNIWNNQARGQTVQYL